MNSYGNNNPLIDFFSTPEFSNMANSMIPDYGSAYRDGNSMYNKADPLSPNGYFSNMFSNKREGQHQTTNQQQYQEDSYSRDSVGFSAIPRMAGLFGRYVTPPQKVSISDMYQMSLDSTIGSVLRTAKSHIISKLGEYVHDDKEKQNVIHETIKQMGGQNFHNNAIDFLKLGFSCAEISWGVSEDYFNIIKDATFAPATNLQFEVDQNGKVLGAIQPTLNNSPYGMMPAADPDMPESVFAMRQIIPNTMPYISVDRENLFYVALDGTFNPYGTSPLRLAYKYYAMKNLALEMFMNALSRNGVPTLAVYYKKDAVKNEEQKRQLQENIDSLTVGGVLYLPGMENEDFKATPIPLDSSGLQYFMDFAKYCDDMAVRALGFPSAILFSDSSGSYAGGDLQKGTYLENLQFYTNMYKEALMDQIVKPVLKANFGKLDDYGDFVSSVSLAEDRINLGKSIEIEKANGTFNSRSLEDVNHYRQAVGLSKLTSVDQLPPEEETRGTNVRDAERPYSNQDDRNLSISNT